MAAALAVYDAAGGLAGAIDDGETEAAAAAAEEEEAQASSPGPWRPTDEWLYGVKRVVPLRPLLLLIEYLEPLVERHVKTMSLGVDDAGVLEVRM